METFILASASPRRQQLLRLLGCSFVVQAIEVDEDVITTPNPADNVRERALLKISHWQPTNPTRPVWVIAADTTVAVDEQMLNKPATPAEAKAMLNQLCGRTHQVYTGLAVRRYPDNQLFTAVHATDVVMRDYSEAEIEAYIASGDPFDKAGAYAIQHPVFRPVTRLEGCYFNVVGLPLCTLAQLLLQAQAPLPAGEFSTSTCRCHHHWSSN